MNWLKLGRVFSWIESRWLRIAIILLVASTMIWMSVLGEGSSWKTYSAAAEKGLAKQAAIARQISALQGKTDPAEWALQVTPITKNLDGRTSEGSVIRYSKATGQAERVDVGHSAKTAQQFKQGEVYRDAAGNTRRWNGAGWEKA